MPSWKIAKIWMPPNKWHIMGASPPTPPRKPSIPSSNKF